VQFALVTGGLIAVIGVVLAARRGSQPRVKALLLRNYGLNLAILLGLVAAVSLGAYAVRVARDSRSRPNRRHDSRGKRRSGARGE
jgi:drug/metabolite transporter (DMT)-like permease